jgi:hypothetical protein
MLRARRNADLFLQNQREISAGLVEKLLKLERPVAYALYREQFNPDLSRYPTRWSKNGFRWERLEHKKKSPPSLNRLSIGRLPKERDADH